MKKLLGIVLLLSGVAAQAGVFSDDFSNGIRSTFWTVTQTSVNLYSVDGSKGDVRFAKINDTPGGLQYIGLTLNLNAVTATGVSTISGDFIMQVDFREANISGGGLNQVELHSAYTDNQIFFTVRDESNVHVWINSYHNGFDTGTTSGTFKITRAGNLVSGYLNDALIWQTNYTAADLNLASFILQNNNGSNNATSVIFDNFSIEGVNIIPEPATIALLSLGALSLIRRKK
jgi:hypothetical protein